MKPEEKKAKDRQLWKDWIDQYRYNKIIISICVFLIVIMIMIMIIIALLVHPIRAVFI